MPRSLYLLPALLGTSLLVVGCAKNQEDSNSPDTISPIDGQSADGSDDRGNRIKTSTSTRGVDQNVKGATARLKAGKPVRDPDKPRGELPPRKALGELAVEGFAPSEASPGSTVEIFGTGFMATPDRNKVTVGGVRWTVDEAFADRLLVTVPENAKDGSLKVKAGNRTATADESFVLTTGGPAAGTNGLLGSVFDIDDGATAMPDFSGLGDPLHSVALVTVDVESRPAADGFPGLRLDDASFAIQFTGSLNIVEEGEYELCLNSDDGSQLLLEDTMLVDNGGAKTAAEEKCEIVFLEAGEYVTELRYFNAGDSDIALQMSWSKDGGAREPVPESVLFRPDSLR